MTWMFRTLCSSIGKKQCVAVSGLLLCGFLVLHLLGNFLLFFGKDAFDAYAEAMTSNLLFYYPAEAILAALFLVHIVFAVWVTIENRRARPVRYVARASAGERTIASSTMIYSGIIVLVFLVLHLKDFRFAKAEGASLYDLVIDKFHGSYYVIWYVFASCVVALHVSHGFQSAFRSLGLSQPKCVALVRIAGRLFAIFVAVGYASLPLYAYFFAEGAQ